MTKECPYCGAEIMEGSRFCTRCGMSLEEKADTSGGTAAPVKKKWIRWWMIPLAAVLIAAVVVIAMWGKISLYVLPEVKLAEAVMHTGADISQRMEGSPLQILGSSAQWERGYTTDVDFDLTIAGFGGFGLSASSAYDPANHASSMTTKTEVMGDSSVTGTYYDRDRVVFTLDAAGDALSYGIDFASFEEDLKNNPAIDQQTAEDLIAAAEAFRLPAASGDREALNERYMQVFTDLLGSSSRRVSYENYAVDGVDRSCGTISYTLDNLQLAECFESLALIAEEDEALQGFGNSQPDLYGFGITGEEQTASDIPESLRETAQSLRQDPSGSVTVIFRIYEEYLVAVSLTATAEETTEFTLDAVLGSDASAGDILITVRSEEGESSYLLETDKDTETYSEKLTIISGGTENTISYSWNEGTGELPVCIEMDGDTLEIDAFLARTGEGYTLTLPDVLELMESEYTEDLGFLLALAKLNITISVSEGAVVEFPSYKTPDRWTEDDLNTVMEYFLG